MKLKMTFFILALYFSSLTTITSAQTSIPQGKVQLIEFSNSTAKFTVPEGKTWYINNVFSLSIAENKGFYIYLKSINGTELTNLSENQFGPIIYAAYTVWGTTITFPLIFPQNTTFELLILNFKTGGAKFTLSDKNAYINYTEIDN